MYTLLDFKIYVYKAQEGSTYSMAEARGAIYSMATKIYSVNAIYLIFVFRT